MLGNRTVLHACTHTHTHTLTHTHTHSDTHTHTHTHTHTPGRSDSLAQEVQGGAHSTDQSLQVTLLEKVEQVLTLCLKLLHLLCRKKRKKILAHAPPDLTSMLL